MPFSAKDGIIIVILNEANEAVIRDKYAYFGGYGNTMKVQAES